MRWKQKHVKTTKLKQGYEKLFSHMNVCPVFTIQCFSNIFDKSDLS